MFKPRPVVLAPAAAPVVTVLLVTALPVTVLLVTVLIMTVLIMTAALSLAAGSAHAADWPQLLGPTQNGVSSETGLMGKWGTGKAGPRRVWKRKMGGGFSSIAAVGGKLFTMYSSGTAEFAAGIDASSGSELWRRALGTVYEDSMGGDGPRSTPTVVGDTVFVFGASGTLTALEVGSGKPRWKREAARELGGEIPKWGYSGSPLVHGGRVFIDIGGKDGHGIVAFDATSGETAWKVDGFKAGYSSPVPFRLGRTDVIGMFTGKEMVLASPADGTIHWRQRWETSYDVNSANPIFLGPDRLFISSGYGVGSALFTLVEAAGKVTGRMVWRNKVMKNKMSTSVPVGGALYGVSSESLTAMDIDSGEERWSHDGIGWGTLIAADGKLIVLDSECNLRLVKASAERYEELGQRKVLGERCWTVPALSNGILYLRDEVQISAWDIRKR